MRKLLAILLTISLVFPLVLASQSTISVASWALDRQFYIDALNNQQVYDNLLSDEMLDEVLRSHFALPSETNTQGLIDILRSIISDDYLKEQLSAVVNDFFDYLHGTTDQFEPVINIQPIKSALTDEKQAEFLAELVGILPICASGQTPGLGGEGQTLCKPAGISDEVLIENFLAPALPSLLEQLPDELPLGEEWQHWQSQENWRSFLPGMAVPASLLLSVLFLAFVAVCFWYITALIADSSWRVRLQWLGWTLLIPSVLIFVLGFVLQSGNAQYWMNFGLQNAMIQIVPSVQGTRAILEAVSASILPRISTSLLMVGGICGGLSLALIMWGLVTPRKKVEE